MSEAIFFNVWRARSSEEQRVLLAAMQAELPSLTSKPGFLNMTAWAGRDGDARVIVEARWASRAHFDAAVAESPEAHAGRARLEKLGSDEPGLFERAFETGPSAEEGAGKGLAAGDASGLEESDELFKQTQERWARSGFGTRLVQANGIKFHVAEGGAGKPLVLLHGYPQSGEIWRLIAPDLARSYRVIIPDLRGMGLSEIAADGYGLPNLAEDIHQLARTLDLGEIAVVSHDWGGAVAAVYALRYRDDVRRLAFIESAVGGAGFEALWTFTQPNPAMTFIPLLLNEPLSVALITGREEQYLHQLWSTFTVNKEVATFDTWRPYVAAIKRPGLIRSTGSYYRSVYGSIDSVRDSISQGKLAIPVLSIAGRGSFADGQRPFVEAFASNIVRHTVIDNAGHFIAEEQPQALLKELRSFLAE